MTWTVVVFLSMLVMILVLRLLAWWGLRFFTHFFDKTVIFLKQAREQDDISAAGSQIKAKFPATTKLLKARLTPERFTGLPLTLVVIAALYIAALLGGLVEELFEADELVRFDEGFNQQLATVRTDVVVTLFAWITELGGSATLVAVALVTTGLLWAHSHIYMIAPLWLTLLGSQITTYAGKYAIARPRPEFVTDVVAVTPSFPSGHATSAMAVYGFIAYLLAVHLSGVRQRFEVIYWTAVLIALVGFSRILLSLHYASDIAAGFLVGGFWLLLGFALAEHRRHQMNWKKDGEGIKF
ncbi:phosphatase PAP2 family protein [Thiohalophilus sp.]|uniref:phosphatase PAP2 family protein n=1 Tax=Thiohalophilus sp. TaxID=3028392 RepID=UPI002ACD2FEA|nr:phosphatase PAP2 family protein [Thiohalophilus sp.]MDZ7803171.1 phosphatase PAP2 family protein [Thiohalophilus sp.]